jgi:hypothetical protein
LLKCDYLFYPTLGINSPIFLDFRRGSCYIFSSHQYFLVVLEMSKCPNCGAEEANSVKSWSMIGKPSKSGEMFKLTISLYECKVCGKSFRCVKDKEKITMKGVLDRSNELEEKLMEATKKRAELEKNIQALEEEKACLCAEIDALRIIPTLVEKASFLESTVTNLREEKQALLAKINDLMAEKTVAPKEKTLEAFLTESEPEVKPMTVEVAQAKVEDVIMEQCVETQVEAPVVVEQPCECLPTEPDVGADKTAAVLPPESVPILDVQTEVPIAEHQQVSVSEPLAPEPILFETTSEAPLVEEKSVEVSQIKALPETFSSAEVTEQPFKATTIEATVIDEKAPEALHTEFVTVEPAPIIVTPEEVKTEETIVTTPTSTETLVKPSLSESVVEIVTAREDHSEELHHETSPIETQPSPNNVEASAEPVINIVPVEEVSSLLQEVKANVVGANATDASQMVETVEVLGKPEVVIMPSTDTQMKEETPATLIIEAESTIETNVEKVTSETTVVDVSKEAEKLKDRPVIEDTT